MSNITQSRKTLDYFRSEVERLAEKHNVTWILEPSKEDSDYAYFKYIEDGYTPSEALKHMFHQSGMGDDPSFR